MAEITADERIVIKKNFPEIYEFLCWVKIVLKLNLLVKKNEIYGHNWLGMMIAKCERTMRETNNGGIKKIKNV